MESNDFISQSEIVSDMITEVNDESLSKGLDISFYNGCVRRAVEYFSVYSFFNIITKDFYNIDKENNGVFEIPLNMFNIREIYLFSSSSCNHNSESCTCSSALNNFSQIFWKRNLNRGNGGNLATSRIVDGVYERVLNPDSKSSSCVKYCNIQSGKIIFGDTRKWGYKNIRIVYNGFGKDCSGLPIIPTAMRQGIYDKSVLFALETLKNRDNSYNISYRDVLMRFEGNTIIRGSKRETTGFVKKLDRFKRESMKEYFGNADII